MDLRPADLSDPAAAPLLRGLAAMYREKYGALLDGEFDAYDACEFRPPTGTLLLLRDGGETVAGGALRRWAEGIGEIKRMWTAPEHRRRGHGWRVLVALERAAAGYGYRAVRLETGRPERGAIALYRRAGYHEIPPYGRMAHDPRCICFEKRL